MGQSSQDKSHANSGHIVQLDGLRALAVVAVVFNHYGPDGAIGTVLDTGALGVRLFFVLSGFLITGILLDARESATRHGVPLWGVLQAFYIRRFLRIFPLYYFTLFVCVVSAVPSAREFILWHLTYTTNVLMATSNSYLPALGHFWSLAVEEQFYLLWPAIVLLTPTRRLTPVLTAVILVGPVSRALLAVSTGELITSTMLMPSCLDTLGCGALIAHLRRRRSESPDFHRRLVRAALGLGIALYATWFALRYLQIGWVAKVVIKDLSYTLLFSWVVYRAADGFSGFARPFLEWRPLVYLGTISYGVYVYHDVLPLIDRSVLGGAAWRSLALDSRGVTPFLVVLFFSVLVASVSWHAFEAPLNRMKSRFPYTPARAGDSVGRPAGAAHPQVSLPSYTVATEHRDLLEGALSAGNAATGMIVEGVAVAEKS